MSGNRSDLLNSIESELHQLTDSQVGWVETVISQFRREKNFKRNEQSDIISQCVLDAFGDALLIHHCFSKEAFTKDKFEYALERVLNLCGTEAILAARGNPGHDITIDGCRVSLKTQADHNIKPEVIWISKFMELGRGEWSDNPDDLIGLRERYFRHMDSYDRIFTLRKLLGRAGRWQYELVEIPKDLLQEAQNGRLEMMLESRQMPKPGYCYVTSDDGSNKFHLYFDGGGERKLQVKSLEKRFCIVHAEWSFQTG